VAVAQPGSSEPSWSIDAEPVMGAVRGGDA
jgi:hypothetical protein